MWLGRVVTDLKLMVDGGCMAKIGPQAYRWLALVDLESLPLSRAASHTHRRSNLPGEARSHDRGVKGFSESPGRSCPEEQLSSLLPHRRDPIPDLDTYFGKWDEDAVLKLASPGITADGQVNRVVFDALRGRSWPSIVFGGS